MREFIPGWNTERNWLKVTVFPVVVRLKFESGVLRNVENGNGKNLRETLEVYSFGEIEFPPPVSGTPRVSSRSTVDRDWRSVSSLRSYLEGREDCDRFTSTYSGLLSSSP